MGFFSKALGLGIVKTAEGVAGVVNQFMETPDEKRAAEIVMTKLNQNSDKWQTEINKIEAGHRSLFVAGWRPAIGWICAFGLVWGWILAPFIQFLFPTHTMPTIETGQAIALVMAMLGVGGLRSYEKKMGVTS